MKEPISPEERRLIEQTWPGVFDEDARPMFIDDSLDPDVALVTSDSIIFSPDIRQHIRKEPLDASRPV
jgi:hypothetical protein